MPFFVILSLPFPMSVSLSLSHCSSCVILLNFQLFICFYQSIFATTNFIYPVVSQSIILMSFIFYLLSYSLIFHLKVDFGLPGRTSSRYIIFGVCCFLYQFHLSFLSLLTENPAQGLDAHKSQSAANRQCPLLTMLWPHLLIQGEAEAVTKFLPLLLLSFTAYRISSLLFDILAFIFSPSFTCCLHLCFVSTMHSALQPLYVQKSVL